SVPRARGSLLLHRSSAPPAAPQLPMSQAVAACQDLPLRLALLKPRASPYGLLTCPVCFQDRYQRSTHVRKCARLVPKELASLVAPGAGAESRWSRVGCRGRWLGVRCNVSLRAVELHLSAGRFAAAWRIRRSSASMEKGLCTTATSSERCAEGMSRTAW